MRPFRISGRRRRVGLLVAVGAAVGLVAWWVYDWLTEEELPPGIIVASGRLEGRRVRVSAGAEGRVLLLAVREGDMVRAGQLVAILDRRIERAEVERARADVAAAEAGERAALARTGGIQSELSYARAEAKRLRRLVERGAASRDDAERVEATAGRLEGELRAAEELRLLAAKRTAAAQAVVEALEVQLGENTVEAPVPGTVEHELARVGERVAPGMPIVTLLRLDDVKLRVYLPLVEAERVSPGLEARVYLDAFRDRFFPGVVERIASEAEFTPKDVHMPDERATLVFAVDVRIPDPGRALKDGMPADVFVRWDPAASWPEERPWR